MDIYGEAFFEAIKELGVSETAAVEGYNGAAPPDMERSVSCIYSQSRMRERLEKFGLRFSNYGSQSRAGPTIGMALVTMAHYQYPEIDIFRLGAMAPMYPFLTRDSDPPGHQQGPSGLLRHNAAGESRCSTWTSTLAS